MLEYARIPVGRMPRTSRLIAVTGALGLALGTGVLPVPCPLNLVTGLDCPFCGGSRMIGALLRADFARVLDLNAFALLILLPLVAVVLFAMARRELGYASSHWPRGVLGRVSGYALITAGVAWGVLRNLPFEPFTALRA
ncbi:DUF2752 domain-containing protein [Haloactinomyces albus]|uniref:DUF2752 domain-containing protein n=1 Tax=Haloactinomyces albus TaxID=1352928 RepID=A0AAE3Z9P5_9ACTN|nr:DUF2752 domain-containing protein [Haloactinomyces albus]MDR7300906.1 hypothetical protein [Haloactinomyces albus]